LALYHQPHKGSKTGLQVLLFGSSVPLEPALEVMACAKRSDIWIDCDSKFVEIFLVSEVANAALLRVIRLDAAIANIQKIEEDFMINP